MQKVPMTVEGFTRLEDELRHLKGVESILLTADFNGASGGKPNGSMR